ncbi:MAG TPA: CoA transferase [Hyphomicrobiales bacterium]|nr:CoA transferase [Hyphomicrobiales bacterium]
MTEAPLTLGALDGIRIVDLTDASCVYATKILVDLGGEVIRVEPPEGDPMRRQPPLDTATGDSLFHAFMNVNKRSVTLDLDTAEGRDLFRRLVDSADVVIESRAPGSLDRQGIGYRALAGGHPALVWTSVTPFGSTGPYAEWQADDLIIQAMGGLMTLSGLPDREPLRLYGEQTCFIAGLHAASGTLMAYWHALMTGEGQHVDVSVQECVAHTLENAIQYYTAEDHVRGRTRGREEPGAGVFQCLDGEVFLMAGLSMISSSWHNLVALMVAEGTPGADGLLDPKWVDHAWRKTVEARTIANDIVARFTATKTKNQVYDLTQQHRILSAPMNQVGDLFDNAQLKFLNWFQDQAWGERVATWPGPPIRMSETPRRAPVRVAKAGADDAKVLGTLAARAEKESAA